MDFSISFLQPNFLGWLILAILFIGLGLPLGTDHDYRRKWLGLAIRLLILISLVLGLSGMQVERPTDDITTIFIMDMSDSVTVEERHRAETFLSQALATKPDNDKAGIILFGGDALVERLPHIDSTMPILSSIPIPHSTNIENALRLAFALLPNEEGSRIVLMSDGQETIGKAEDLIELAQARHVEVSTYPIRRSDSLAGMDELDIRPTDVLVKQVYVPSRQAQIGDEVPVEITVSATHATNAMLRLLMDGMPLESHMERLTTGDNSFRFSVPMDTAGFHRLRVEVEAESDSRLQNNWGGAFIRVRDEKNHILIVESQIGETQNIAVALQSAQFETTTIPPSNLPDTVTGLAEYDSIILANVPVIDLSTAKQKALVAFVQDIGHGLVMLGGPNSYGAGAYLRQPLAKALPVEIGVRNKEKEPNIALVMAVDKSGSMGQCHCDNPDDAGQRSQRDVSGLPKVDIAKEAVFQAASALGNLDYMGVVAFDRSAHWQIELQPLVNASTLDKALGNIGAKGSTNIFAGLTAAEVALIESPARVKHVILLTDGWSSTGYYSELVKRFEEEGITLSIIAAGDGAANYLSELARNGGGKYYPATSMLDVPKIFLKETIRAVGNYTIEEPFSPVGGMPSPILHGISAMPPLLGYNGTTAKNMARTSLLTTRGDPLLATWQFGLGRSVAWTSDLSSRWAKTWLDWDLYSRFVVQMIKWTLPTFDDDAFQLDVTVQHRKATLEVQLLDESEVFDELLKTTPLNVTATFLANNGDMLKADLLPIGVGHYQSTVSLPSEGVYLTQIVVRTDDEANKPIAHQTTGIVASYSAEYANVEANTTLLNNFAQKTGGMSLTDPSQAYAHNLALSYQTQPIWFYCLLLAVLLFPFDVAIRRLRIGQREWHKLRQHVIKLMPGREPSPTVAPLEQPAPTSSLQAFRHVRQRATETAHTGKGEKEFPSPSGRGARGEGKVDPTGRGEKETPLDFENVSGDTLSRLRQAKKRAKKH